MIFSGENDSVIAYIISNEKQNLKFQGSWERQD